MTSAKVDAALPCSWEHSLLTSSAAMHAAFCAEATAFLRPSSYRWPLVVVQLLSGVDSLLTSWQASKSRNELLGQGISTVLEKLEDLDDGELGLKEPSFLS